MGREPGVPVRRAYDEPRHGYAALVLVDRPGTPARLGPLTLITSSGACS